MINLKEKKRIHLKKIIGNSALHFLTKFDNCFFVNIMKKIRLKGMSIRKSFLSDFCDNNETSLPQNYPFHLADIDPFYRQIKAPFFYIKKSWVNLNSLVGFSKAVQINA